VEVAPGIGEILRSWRQITIVALFATSMLPPLVWCGDPPESPKTVSLTVSAAISLKDALDDLRSLYERQHPGVRLTFNYGGSGTLQHQIEQGAPVDLFISASEGQMKAIESEGLLLSGTRVNLLKNSLVLIVPASESFIRNLDDLAGTKVRTIALGEPSTVPAGAYATQSLKSLGLFSAVREKIVYAKDVRAVLAYVETGNADAGFVYETDAQTSSKVRVAAIAPPDSHVPIVYPAAVLRGSPHPAAAREFLAFLQGPDAQKIFAKDGFLPAENQPKKK
jgi:molybdate transport system substrate-binding protein